MSPVEVPIQYARTVHGVNIAVWRLGSGEPLVYMAGAPWCHVELLQDPECVRWYQQLAAERRLVRYDVRGTGLSDREIEDHSLEAQILDLEAVIEAVGIGKFSLFAVANAGPTAIAYANQNPERVTSLILWCSWAKGSEILSPRIDAWRGLLDYDWQLMTDTCAHLALGWSEGEIGRQAAQNLRGNITPSVMKAALGAVGEFDVSAMLPNIKAPTLVFSQPNISWIPVQAARTLAASIPDARLSIQTGESTAPYLGDTEAVLAILRPFLDSETHAADKAGVHDLFAEADTPNTVSENDQNDAAPNNLTGREKEVLGLIARGRTNNEVASELVLSIRTVERHIGNIYAKIGARGRADATVYALDRGIV